jgi:tetratricopeptide (TPR) repeat protein
MNLSERLTTLEGAGLVLPAQLEPELEYLFRHALVQEAAYDSLLRADRRFLHLLVGQALERLYPERLDEMAATLAYHFEQAEAYDKTLGYLLRAGDAAAGVYANAEAVLHYGQALDLLHTAAPGALGELAEPGKLWRDLYLRRGRALELSDCYQEALQNYHAMQATAQSTGDRKLALAALAALAIIHGTPSPAHNLEMGRSYGEQALALARALGDRQAECQALWSLMLTYYFAGQPQQSVEYGEQSLALAQELGERERIAFAMHDLFRGYSALGQFERAEELIQGAQQYWRAIGNLPMLADSLTSQAEICMALGRFDCGIEMAQEAFQISQAIDNHWGLTFSGYVLCEMYWERGELDLALHLIHETLLPSGQGGYHFLFTPMLADIGSMYGALGLVERGLVLAEEANRKTLAFNKAMLSWTAAQLARLYILSNDLQAAETALQTARAFVKRENFANYGPIFVLLAETELALAKQDYPLVIEFADQLLAMSDQNHVRIGVVTALKLKGRALLRLERLDEAWGCLDQARQQMESAQVKFSLWEVLAWLARVERRQGLEQQAQAHWQGAARLLNELAARLPDDLRAVFLARADVKQVLQEAIPDDQAD